MKLLNISIISVFLGLFLVSAVFAHGRGDVVGGGRINPGRGYTVAVGNDGTLWACRQSRSFRPSD